MPLGRVTHTFASVRGTSVFNARVNVDLDSAREHAVIAMPCREWLYTRERVETAGRIRRWKPFFVDDAAACFYICIYVYSNK